MKTINNNLGPNTFSYIKEKIDNPNFPWYYAKSTANIDTVDPHTLDFSFYHLVYFEEPKSNIFDPLFTAFLECLDKSNQELKTLLRIRIGLVTPTTQCIIHAPHIDYDMPHKTALLYLNSTDGDTIFYNQFFDASSNINNQEFIKGKNLEILSKVTPEENKFVMFDGLQFHSSSTPTKEKRIVVNFNYETR